ncbi:MAG: tRNA-dihydrouridine synthase [Patescibacteria group bacterium]
MKIFWFDIKKPILALAPMAGYTDSAFRQICKEFGADLVYSEMASVTALSYAPEKTLAMLKFFKIERPYIVQLFGSEPEHFIKAVQIIENKLKPDGVDINFGCPVKKVQKQGAGAVLMDKPKLAKEIIKAVINNTDLPVSIKVRSRVGQTDVLKFLNYVNDLDIKAVMIHGRTMAQGFSGPVDWQIIKKARDYFPGIILANGGVKTAEDAIKLLEQTGSDGIGIARGALGRPWIFNEVKSIKLPPKDGSLSACGMKPLAEKVKNSKEIFRVALKHARLAEILKGKDNLVEMRKHLCWYVQGLPGAREMRNKLVKVKSVKDIEIIFKYHS